MLELKAIRLASQVHRGHEGRSGAEPHATACSQVIARNRALPKWRLGRGRWQNFLLTSA